MCTAMLFDPVEAEAKIKAAEAARLQTQPVKTETVVTPEGELVTPHRHRVFKGNFKLFERWVRFKQFVLLRGKRDDGDTSDKRKSILSLLFW